MKLTAVRSSLEQLSTDLLVVFVFQDDSLFKKHSSQLSSMFSEAVAAFSSKDFTGKEGDALLLYTQKKKNSTIVLGRTRGVKEIHH
jgi:hypothetical protein